MGKYQLHPALHVFLNGQPVGLLSKETSGAIHFQYARSWLDWEYAMPISLSLPLRKERFSGTPVIAVFENMLPDNDLIRHRIAERMHAKGTDAYNLLNAIGKDCVGALQFLSENETSQPGIITGKEISDTEVSKILGDLENSPLGLSDDEDFRISLAGAQEKTALLFWKEKWHKPHGTTATTHILKPQIGRLPNGIDLSNSVENEYLCLKILTALGLPTTTVAIKDFKNQRVLVVERFDRLWTQDQRLLRLPQEDFCQALSIPPSIKYEADGGPGITKILNVLKGSDTPTTDREIFMKAQIAFWLLGATDGHAKNFSIFLSQGGRFHLTPLYDVLSAQPSFDSGQIRKNKMKLAMSIGHNRHYTVDTITARHFLQTAEKANLNPLIVQNIFDDLIENSEKAINSVLGALPKGFPELLTSSIIKGFLNRLRRLKN